MLWDQLLTCSRVTQDDLQCAARALGESHSLTLTQWKTETTRNKDPQGALSSLCVCVSPPSKQDHILPSIDLAIVKTHHCLECIVLLEPRDILLLPPPLCTRSLSLSTHTFVHMCKHALTQAYHVSTKGNNARLEEQWMEWPTNGVHWFFQSRTMFSSTLAHYKIRR